MDAMDLGYESEEETMPTEMLEDIRDSSNSHPSIKSREARYK